MRGRFGSLTTRGWGLLAAGAGVALCAVLVHERDLLRVAAFAIVLPVLAILVISRTRIGLQVERKVMPSRTPVGGDCQVHLTLRGTGRWSGRLLLEDVVPRELGGPRRAVVAQLPQQHEAQVMYSLHPMERAVHSLGPLIGRVTDPLGLAQCHRTLAGTNRLVVLPAVLPLVGSPAGGEFGAGTAGDAAAGAGPDPDAVVVRSYQQGDDLRRVHWRTTARRDELMVRVEEWAQRGGMTVLLDHRTAAHRGAGHTSSLEYAVSLAASVYVHLRQRGTRLRLVTVDGAVLAGAGNGADYQTDTALDALAALCATDQRDLTDVPVTVGSQDVVAILGALGPAAVEQLLVHHLRSARGHAVLLDVAAWATDSDGKLAPDPAKAARHLIAAGWSVVVAGPQHSPSAVWNQLCVSSRSRLQVPR
ncbi:MAG: DUF58 domain-containing protein [Actinomycetota bacterium]|nr:DUF58 domain-containing protein [Actinomycetota bacterium]